MGRANKQTVVAPPKPVKWEYREAGFTRISNRVFTDRTCSKDEIAVFLALAFHADREGECHPSLARIGSYGRSSKTTVLKALKALELKGYISKTTGSTVDGKRHANRYVVQLPIGVHGPSRYHIRVPGNTPDGTPRYQEQVSSEQYPKKKNGMRNNYERFLADLNLPYRIQLNNMVFALMERLNTEGLLDPTYFRFVSEKERSSGHFIVALKSDMYRKAWSKVRTKCPECGITEGRHQVSCSINSSRTNRNETQFKRVEPEPLGDGISAFRPVSGQTLTPGL